MKPHLCLLLALSFLVVSCFTFDPVEHPSYTPAEIELEVDTCHLSAQVIVAYEESYNDGNSYFFFVLLDEYGNTAAYVYTQSLEAGAAEAGEEISITYHYPANDSPPLYNEPGRNNESPSKQKVEIIICDWNG